MESVLADVLFYLLLFVAPVIVLSVAAFLAVRTTGPVSPATLAVATACLAAAWVYAVGSEWGVLDHDQVLLLAGGLVFATAAAASASTFLTLQKAGWPGLKLAVLLALVPGVLVGACMFFGTSGVVGVLDRTHVALAGLL